MPYISEKIKLNKKIGLDRRIKLTEAERQEIRELYTEKTPIRAIARAFPQVTRRTIQFVLFPNRLKTVNYPKHWKKYYNTVKNTQAIKNTRRYKQKLYLDGKIKKLGGD